MAVSLDMRSDNWLRKQISKLEKRNSSLMGGLFGRLAQAGGALNEGRGIFDKKIQKYQALLDSRAEAKNAQAPSTPQPPAENPWAENTFSQNSTNLASNTGSLYGGAKEISENQPQSMMPQMYNQSAVFSPETNQAAAGMFGAQQPQPSFDRTLPPTPGVVDPDSMGINSLYNTN